MSRPIGILCIALVLTGCFETKQVRQAKQVRHDSWHITGGAGTFAVDLVVALDSVIDTDEHAESRSGIDAQALAGLISAGVKAGLAAGTGGASLGVGQIVTALGGTSVLGAIGAAVLKGRSQKAIDEGWDAKHEEAVARARAEGRLEALAGKPAVPA